MLQPFFRSAAPGLKDALVTIVAVVVNFVATYAICTKTGANASAAVLCAALTVGFMRRPEHREWRAFLTKFAALPLVGLAAAGVGFTLRQVPAAGAVLFSLGIALSIRLRAWGEFGAALGRAIALPFIAILVVPVSSGGGIAQTLLLAAVAGAIALAGSTAIGYLAERAGFFAPKTRVQKPARTPPPRPGVLPPQTRMALQMLTALLLAFAAGMSLFGDHWPWAVLTAFIVTSGAVASGDALYKAAVRLSGAIAGTLAASLVALVSFPNPPAYAALIFGVLFLGIWLRERNYAYWAACATILFALLQGPHDRDLAALAAMRIGGIFAGALCGIAATSLVYPVRTEQLVRRRVGDALAATRDFLAGNPADPEHRSRFDALARHAGELHRVAPPARLHRTLFARGSQRHPAAWIEAMHALIDHVRTPDFDRRHAAVEMRRVRDMIRKDEDEN